MFMGNKVHENLVQSIAGTRLVGQLPLFPRGNLGTQVCPRFAHSETKPLVIFK